MGLGVSYCSGDVAFDRVLVILGHSQQIPFCKAVASSAVSQQDRSDRSRLLRWLSSHTVSVTECMKLFGLKSLGA